MPTAPPTAPPAATAPAPTPGGTFHLPTLFLTIVESKNGSVTALVNPGASCDAIARLPDNQTVLALGTKIAPTSGYVNWTYPKTTFAGIGVHRVTCTKDGETATEENRFTAP